MAVSKLNSWTPITILLVVIIIAGGIVAWSRYTPGQPVEISMLREEEWQGSIYITGAVNSAGLYPFLAGDSMEILLQSAGGTTGSANLSGLTLYVPQTGEGQEVQKIDINRAEAWLLEALPGIGETLAQRIVDYRCENGPFHSTSELLNVAGIGDDTYEQIKHLVTVSD